jgi:hypothetical protein
MVHHKDPNSMQLRQCPSSEHFRHITPHEMIPLCDVASFCGNVISIKPSREINRREIASKK